MRSLWVLVLATACSDARRGTLDPADDSAAPADDSAAGDDWAAQYDITGDGNGFPNNGGGNGSGDDTGGGGNGSGDDTGDSGSTGGTVDTAGDCPVTIPKDVVVIADDSFLTDDGLVVYVCKNNVLSLTGSGATVFVGVGGQLWNNSSGNTIYAKSGAELAFYDSDNEVYIEEGVDVEDDSKDATLPLVICTSVTYENEPDC